jgi:thiamine-monophosphate kinase
VREAAALAEAVDLHAMIDLSDGLLADCGRLCEFSGVAATLRASAVPLAPAASNLTAGLTDGEDFELLFAVSRDDAEALLANPPIACDLTRVGEVSAGAGVTVRDAAGAVLTFPNDGFEHGFA